MRRRIMVGMISVVLVVASRSAPGQTDSAAVDTIVEIPGLGELDLDELPPDLRDNIRIPGVTYNDAEQEYVDLPPAFGSQQEDIEQPSARGTTIEAPTPVSVPEPVAPKSLDEKRARDEAVGRMYPQEDRSLQRMRSSETEPGSDTSSDRYRKAFEQLERMESPEHPEQQLVPQPQSWFSSPGAWLSSLADRWSPSSVQAQATSCLNAPAWTSIGPAPIQSLNTVVGSVVKNSGIIKYIAIDPSSPSNSRTLFLGTRDGGIWKTTNAGATWTTTTDNLASPNKTSLQSEAIAVHPTIPSIVIAGTGVGAKLGEFDPTPLNKSIGALRSTDAGVTWSQIGPCKTSDACGTDPTKSTVNVKEVVIDTSTSTTRVWAATDFGLWYSDSAADSAKLPSQITWSRITALPNRSGGNPEWVNHIFALSSSVLFASVQNSDVTGQTHNGWYKSTHRETGPWTSVFALATSQNPQRAAVAKGSNVGTNDTLYSIVTGVSSTCGGATVYIDRIYKSTNSGTTWNVVSFPSGVTCEGFPCNPMCDDGLLSIQVDSQAPGTFVFGGLQLYRSTDGGASAARIGLGVIHPDQNALAFDPANHNILYVGNDGGIWSANFSPSLTWTFLHGNLANLEYYAGSIDPLNYGMSSGGTQDVGDNKGGGTNVWDGIGVSGDGASVIVDPQNSNVIYYTGGSPVQKTTNGGCCEENILNRSTGLPGVAVSSLAMDPTDNQALVIWGGTPPPPTPGGPKVYRTTTGGEQIVPPAPAWIPISQDLNSGFVAITIVPLPSPVPSPAVPSNVMFAASSPGVWMTSNAATWSRVDTQGLPNRQVTNLALDTSIQCAPGVQLCTGSCACTLYATLGDFNAITPSGHIFRSTNSGQTWQDVSGTGTSGLPDVPANKVVIHPSCPNILYAATDMGIYQGTLNNGTCGTVNNGAWTWCAFNSAFPKTALVKDLVAHPDSGILRAFTFGRSAWETRPFPVPNPDFKVNSATPATGVQRNSQRISSGIGQTYSVAWADDRSGTNNWHVYMRGYTYNSSGDLTDLGPEQRVDTPNNSHVAQLPSLAIHPLAAEANCSRLAWHDDRINHVNQHIYAGYMCTDGYTIYPNDLRVDQHTTNINATDAAIAFQPTLDFAVGWQAERSAGATLHDVYARFFGVFGLAKGAQFRVNSLSSTSDATKPAATSDGNNNVYLAWQESDTSPSTDYRIMIARYDQNGGLLNGPVRVDNQASSTARYEVALALQNACSVSGQPCTLSSDCPSGQACAASGVIVAWLESLSDGPETVFRRRLSNTLGVLESPVQVNNPPKAPAGSQRGGTPTIAVDQNNNFVISWNANVNSFDASSWSGFTRSFNASGAGVLNDFRVDLSDRSQVGALRVARGRKECAGGSSKNVGCTTDSQCPGSTCRLRRFAFAWRDNRSSHFDMYTRVVPSE